MKLTDAEWNKVKERMPKKWSKEVELNAIAKSFKGEKFTVLAWMSADSKQEVPAEKLNDFYCVSPVMYDGEPHRLQRNIVHIASGLKAGSFKNRTQAIRTWNLCKDLDIQYSERNQLSVSADYSKFAGIISDNKYI